MQLDWTINPTNLIAFLLALFAFYKFHLQNVERFTRVETKVDLLWQILADKVRKSE